MNDVMPGSAEDFGDLKKAVSWDSDLGEARRLCALRALCVGWVSWSWDLGLDEESRFSELAEARPVVNGGGSACAGVQIEKLG